jgi:predicted secreted protein
MAIKTFKVGKMVIDSNELGSLDNMSLNITIESGDTTSIGDTWNEAISLGKSWNVSGSMKYDPDDTAQAALQQEFIAGDGALADVRVYEDATKFYSGAGIITAFNITKAVGAVDTLSITIQGSGALSYT